MKKFLTAIACLGLAACASNTVTTVDRMTHDPNATNTETILHVWSWNFPTIAENMKQIADAGYTMLQTSPVNACFSPEGANVKILDEKEGNWYHYYQPTDWTVGNNIVGTEEEMKAMRKAQKEAEKMQREVAKAQPKYRSLHYIDDDDYDVLPDAPANEESKDTKPMDGSIPEIKD